MNLLLNGTIYGREYYEEEYIEIESVFNEESSIVPGSKIAKDKVNQWILETYGIRVNEQILQSQLDETNKTEQTLFSIMDDYYTCLCDGMGDNLSPRPIIKKIHHLENEYIALEYNEFEPFTEFYIDSLATGHGYVIVKKVEFSENEIYYPYIKRTDSIENINYDTLEKYANQLDIIKEFETLLEAEIPKASASSITNEIKTDTPSQNSKNTPILWVSIAVITILIIVVAFFYRKKIK